MSDNKKSAEELHCEAVAKEWWRRPPSDNPVLSATEADLANLIARERAAAREQVLEEAAAICEKNEKRERETFFAHLGAHSPYLEGRIKQAVKDAQAIRALKVKP